MSDAMVLKTLLVEDDVLHRKLISEVLAMHGSNPICCDSVEEAAEILLSQRIDLVVLDLGLRGSAGRETIAAFRTMSAWAGPVVVATISTDAVAKRECEVANWFFVQKDSEIFTANLDRAITAALDQEESIGTRRTQLEAIAATLSDVRQSVERQEDTLDEVLKQMFGEKDKLGNRHGGCVATCEQAGKVMVAGQNLGIQGVSKLGYVIGGGLAAALGATWLWLWHALQQMAAK